MATMTQKQNGGDEEIGRGVYKVLDTRMFPVLVCKEEGYWILDHFDRKILTRAEWLEIREKVDAFYDTYSDEAIDEYNEPVQELRYAEAHQSRQEAKRVKPPKSGYIYLIHGLETSWYKIGQSVSPKVRLSQLGTQGPFQCNLLQCFPVADMDSMERLLHERFSSKRAQGEWFNLDSSDLKWFEAFAMQQMEVHHG